MLASRLMVSCDRVPTEDTDNPRHIWLRPGDYTDDLRSREWGDNLLDFNGRDHFDELDRESVSHG